MRSLSRIAFLGALVHLFQTVLAASEMNVTIDDQPTSNNSAIVYMPASTWNQGDGCNFCSAKPNGSLAFDGTWHDASYNPQNGDQTLQISISFTGTAIYTFFIVPDLNTPATTNLNFTLDGEPAGSYHHTLGNHSQFLYNVSTFSKSGLKNAAHTLMLSSGGDMNSLLLFDYAVYTTEKHSIPIGEIVGPAVGGAVAVMILFAILLVVHRRRRARRDRSSTRSAFTSEVTGRFEPDPYLIQGGRFEPVSKKAGLHQTVAIAQLRSGSDYTTTSDTDSRTPVPVEVANGRLGRDALLQPVSLQSRVLSSTGNVDPLPQYESVTPTSQ